MRTMTERVVGTLAGGAAAGLTITAIDEAIFSSRRAGDNTHSVPEDLPKYVAAGAALGLVATEVSPRLASFSAAAALAIAAAVKLQRIHMPS